MAYKEYSFDTCGVMRLQLDPFVYLSLSPRACEFVTQSPVYVDGVTHITQRRKLFTRVPGTDVDSLLERRIDRLHLKYLQPHARKRTKRV